MKSTQKPDIKRLLESYNIENISIHTDNIEPGCAFCVTKYVKELVDLSIEKGAAFIISEENILALPQNIPNIIVPNIKEFVNNACQILYPKKPKYMVGVTGTSGKTSIVDDYRQICTHLGIKSASFGTMGIICSDKDIEKKIRAKYKNNINTPDTTTLHKILNFLAKEGVDYVAFEVSSHGLHQDRIAGIKLNVAIFSNLSQDHLDYHKTMDEYKRAKLKIFTDYLEEKGIAITSDKLLEDDEVRGALEGREVVILREAFRHPEGEVCLDHRDLGNANEEDKYLSHIQGQGPDGHLGFPQDDGVFSSLRMTEIKITSQIQNVTSQDLEFTLDGEEYKTRLNMMGSFQSMNALMAFAGVLSCGLDELEAISAFGKLKPVAGRLEAMTNHSHPYTILVDYSHKPEALEACLKELKQNCKNRLLVLFGCGGDRDSSKRSIMGKIANDIADIVIVTDDNPRTEDPASVRKDVMEGAKDAIEIGDRQKAIKESVEMLEEGDILLLAGKGHEDYQIIGTEKIHLDDAEEVRKYI